MKCRLTTGEPRRATRVEERNCHSWEVYKCLVFESKVTKKTKPKAIKFKAQHKNELHQELLPAAPQLRPPPLRRPRPLRVCQRVLLGRLQELLRKATPLRPPPFRRQGLKLKKKSKKIKNIFKKRKKRGVI